jgi:hypothetical protein
VTAHLSGEQGASPHGILWGRALGKRMTCMGATGQSRAWPQGQWTGRRWAEAGAGMRLRGEEPDQGPLSPQHTGFYTEHFGTHPSACWR